MSTISRFIVKTILFVAIIPIWLFCLSSPIEATDVTADITTDTTWTTTGSPYHLKRNVQVESSATLTINAGVQVIADGNYYLEAYTGDIDVNGTSTNPVTFTHNTATSANSWEGIRAQNGRSVTIDYGRIYYADAGIYGYESGTTISISNTIFTSNMVGIDLSREANLTTSQNTFNSHTYTPLVINPDSGTLNLGSGANVDTLGTGANANTYDVIGIGYKSSVGTICPSNICQISSLNFAGSSNTTYLVIGNWAQSDYNGTLQIDAGIVVKFLSSAYIDMTSGSGAADVNGTSSSKVYFTSVKDDSIGGDTNKDGTSTSPSSGDWDSFKISGGSSSTVDYAEFRYGSFGLEISGGYSATVATVRDCIFDDNHIGIIAYDRCNLTTKRNTLKKSTYTPILINPDIYNFSPGSGTDVDILGTSTEKNTYNAIGISYSNDANIYSATNCPSGGCYIKSYNFAGITNIPYVLLNDYVFTVNSSALNINSKVIIKALSGTDIIVDDGAYISASASANNHIYFTSVKNDFIGGDTNNDTNTTRPTAGDWGNITLQDGGSNVFSYVDFSYGTNALDISVTAAPSITNSNFRYNTRGINYSTSTLPTLTSLNFYRNKSYGVDNNSSGVISAENLWWGYSNGPYDASSGGSCGANTGFGDYVTDDDTNKVDYCPYSTTELDLPALTTGSVTGINDTSATVAGSISNFGYYFADEYGHVVSTDNEVFYLEPIVQWKLNDNADNSTITDSVGSYDATFTGTGGTDDYTSNHSVSGKIGQAIEFDGSNDYFTATVTKPDLPLSISFWVNPDSSTPTGIFDSAAGSTNALGNFSAGYVGWETNNTMVQLNLTAGTWQHLTFIFDYNGNRVIRYYKNGSYQGSFEGGTSSTYNFGTFRVGNGFAGDIDDFRIFDYELQENEIEYLYNSGGGDEGLGYDFVFNKGAISTTGSYSTDLLNLEAGVTYFTKAYLKKTNETKFYGNTVSFTTTGGNSLPVASSVLINGNAGSVDLTEGTTTTIACTGVVTDNDGYGNIQSVKAYLYRTGVGSSAADNNNNHYTLNGDSECTPWGGSGTTENYTCNFAVYYHADPTDAGDYSADNWTCDMIPSDSEGDGTSSSDTIEMNTLLAITVNDNIDYGNLDKGANTGSTNYTTTIQNTGNGQVDIQVSGNNMCTDYPDCAGSVINVSKQQYSTSSFTYGSGSVLGTSSSTLDINLSKPTSDPSNSTYDLYWGIEIPNDVSVQTDIHNGENLITAIADS